eukprot:scaffold2908_cov257-Pinguiococcus_pyrenoidosus.AAC.42
MIIGNSIGKPTRNCHWHGSHMRMGAHDSKPPLGRLVSWGNASVSSLLRCRYCSCLLRMREEERLRRGSPAEIQTRPGIPVASMAPAGSTWEVVMRSAVGLTLIAQVRENLEPIVGRLMISKPCKVCV